MSCCAHVITMMNRLIGLRSADRALQQVLPLAETRRMVTKSRAFSVVLPYYCGPLPFFPVGEDCPLPVSLLTEG